MRNDDPAYQDGAIASVDATIERLGVVLAPDGRPEERDGVLNPASARTRNGELLLYPRCVAAGNVSRVGLVRLNERDGVVAAERLGYALEPSEAYEHRDVPGGYGCEDPRVTFVPVLDAYVMVYTAFGPDGPRVAIAVSHDAYTWERLGLVEWPADGPRGDDKDGCFFPEPVRSPSGVLSLALYHRPMLRLSAVDGHAAIPAILNLEPARRESTRIAYIPLDRVLADRTALLHPVESVLVLAPDAAWGRIKTGAGTPPVRLDDGWLSLFHAVDAVDHDGRVGMVYSAGLVIHDLEYPHIVRYRSAAPVLTPDTADEREGIVNNVVFPTAIDVRREQRLFDIYYGMADAKIGRARLTLNAVCEAGAGRESESAA